jgi:hypothetical protein
MARRGSTCSAEPPPRRTGSSLAALVIAGLMLSLLAVVATAAPAGAETPDLVAEEVADDGVYVASIRDDLDEEQLATAVQQARARGLRLIVVAPFDPQPDPAAFARRVQEASDADAALVFTAEGGVEAHVIDDLESAHFRALAAARSKAAALDAVEVYTVELLAEPSRDLPPIVNQIISIVVILALVLAGAVALEQVFRRTRRSARRAGGVGRPGFGPALSGFVRRFTGL